MYECKSSIAENVFFKDCYGNARTLLFIFTPISEPLNQLSIKSELKYVNYYCRSEGYKKRNVQFALYVTVSMVTTTT